MAAACSIERRDDGRDELLGQKRRTRKQVMGLPHRSLPRRAGTFDYLTSDVARHDHINNAIPHRPLRPLGTRHIHQSPASRLPCFRPRLTAPCKENVPDLVVAYQVALSTRLLSFRPLCCERLPGWGRLGRPVSGGRMQGVSERGTCAGQVSTKQARREMVLEREHRRTFIKQHDRLHASSCLLEVGTSPFQHYLDLLDTSISICSMLHEPSSHKYPQSKPYEAKQKTML